MVMKYKIMVTHSTNLILNRYVKKNWARVVEAMIVSVMSATFAFVLIYFYHDCKPIGAANITRPLQVCGAICRKNVLFLRKNLTIKIH